jgi:DNA polymerase V
MRHPVLCLRRTPGPRARRYGRGSIGLGLGHAGIRGGPDWTMKRDMLSPCYTTHWDELPLVKAA